MKKRRSSRRLIASVEWSVNKVDAITRVNRNYAKARGEGDVMNKPHGELIYAQFGVRCVGARALTQTSGAGDARYV